MKKTYEILREFWVGECNIKLKKGDHVVYDDVSGVLVVSSESSGEKAYEAKNLKAAIKAKWLSPVDGKYPELDGPLGETEDEKMDRKRKERFAAQATKKGDVKGLVKDERQIGVISEESEMFNQLLNAEPVASVKVKKAFSVVEDDTKEVGVAKFDTKETDSLKKALRQTPTEKKDPSTFKVSNEHYDAEAIQVSKYNDTSNESTLQGWSKMHWTKKAEVISTSKDRTFLKQLSSVEKSKKIQERITEQLDSLQ